MRVADEDGVAPELPLVVRRGGRWVWRPADVPTVGDTNEIDMQANDGPAVAANCLRRPMPGGGGQVETATMSERGAARCGDVSDVRGESRAGERDKPEEQTKEEQAKNNSSTWSAGKLADLQVMVDAERAGRATVQKEELSPTKTIIASSDSDSDEEPAWLTDAGRRIERWKRPGRGGRGGHSGRGGGGGRGSRPVANLLARLEAAGGGPDLNSRRGTAARATAELEAASRLQAAWRRRTAWRRAARERRVREARARLAAREAEERERRAKREVEKRQRERASQEKRAERAAAEWREQAISAATRLQAGWRARVARGRVAQEAAARRADQRTQPGAARGGYDRISPAEASRRRLERERREEKQRARQERQAERAAAARKALAERVAVARRAKAGPAAATRLQAAWRARAARERATQAREEEARAVELRGAESRGVGTQTAIGGEQLDCSRRVMEEVMQASRGHITRMQEAQVAQRQAEAVLRTAQEVAAREAARAEGLAEELRGVRTALQVALAEVADMDGPASVVARVVVGTGGRQRQQRREMQQVRRGVLSWPQVAERQWLVHEARALQAEAAAARVREAQKLAEAAHVAAKPTPPQQQSYLPGPGPPWGGVL